MATRSRSLAGMGRTEPGASTRRSSFVGREGELSDLGSIWGKARRGSTALVTISGEPGIGKTRLAAELVQRAERDGALVGWGGCWSGEAAPSLYPWAQVIETLAAKIDGELLSRALSGRKSEIARLVPALAGRGSEKDGEAREGPDVLGAGRFVAFSAVHGFLAQISAVHPVLVVLDDLQWSDQASTELLGFLASTTASLPIMVVGAYRHGTLAKDERGKKVIAMLAAAGRQIELDGLNSEEVARLLDEMLEREAGRRLSEEIRALTGGNPFFIRELAGHDRGRGLERSAVEKGTVTVPKRVEQLVRGYFDELSAECRAILEEASVVGRDLDLHLLSRIRSDEGGRWEVIFGALDEALVSGLLSGTPSVELGYRFPHAIVREVIYEGISTERRAVLHGRVAAALEHLHSRELGRHAAEISYHFRRAPQAASPTRIARYLEEAGKEALDTGGYSDATEHFEAALGYLERPDGDLAADDAVESPLATARTRLLIQLADALYGAGRPEQARAACLRAAELARQAGDARQFGRAAHGYSYNTWWRGPGGGSAQSRALLEEAVAMVPENHRNLRIKLLGALTGEMVGLGERCDDVAAVAGQVMALGEDSNDPAALGYALGYYLLTLSTPGDLQERLDVSERVISVAGRTGYRMLEFWARLFRSWSLLGLGRLADLEEEVGRIARLNEHAPHPVISWLHTSLEIMLGLDRGSLERVSELIPKEFEQGMLVDEREAQVHYAGHEPFRLLYAGDLEQVEQLLGAAASAYPEYRLTAAGHSYVLAKQGKVEEARAVLARLVGRHGQGLAEVPRDSVWAMTLALLGDAMRWGGSVTHAARAYELLLPLSGQNLTAGIALYSGGPVDRALGNLALCMGRKDLSAEHFEAALAMVQATGSRGPEIWVRSDLAGMLVDRNQAGDGARAVEMIEAAERAAGDIGASTVAFIPEGLRERAEALAEATSTTEGRSVSDAALVSTFRRADSGWTVAFTRPAVTLRARKGFAYIAYLLAHPHLEFHAAELRVLTDPPPPAEPGTELVGAMSGAALGQEGMHAERKESDQVAFPDARALTAYRTRLGEAEQELTEAVFNNDQGRYRALGLEVDQLRGELVRLAARRQPASERARKSVANRVRGAISTIRDVQPELADHLAGSLRLGTFCSYRPAKKTNWEL